MSDQFGDRMKMYESRETGRFMPLIPIYARLDGKGFSKYTRGMNRPYDIGMQKTMIDVTKYLVEHTQAKIGYTQSDEISLVWYSDSIDSQVYFDGKKQKIVSVLAAMATAVFNNRINVNMGDDWNKPFALFDCRAFQLPNLVEAANAILWREQDATKNAISMAASHYFHHSELQGKNGKEMQEMLFQNHKINFNDYPAAFKRGTFVRHETYDSEITDEQRARWNSVKYPPVVSVKRSRIVEMDMPKFSSVINRTGVIFNKEDPETTFIETETKWKPTLDRMHEECDGCELKNVLPIACDGHEEGPVSCSDFMFGVGK